MKLDTTLLGYDRTSHPFVQKRRFTTRSALSLQQCPKKPRIISLMNEIGVSIND
jgi:hypothetical protein